MVSFTMLHTPYFRLHTVYFVLSISGLWGDQVTIWSLFHQFLMENFNFIGSETRTWPSHNLEIVFLLVSVTNHPNNISWPLFYDFFFKFRVLFYVLTKYMLHTTLFVVYASTLCFVLSISEIFIVHTAQVLVLCASYPIAYILWFVLNTSDL